MTTIANYNVNLSMDANSYIDSTKLSRRETSSLQRTINSTRTPAEKYERTIRQLDNALEKGAISQGTYNNLLEKQAQKFEKTSRAAKKFSGGLSKIAAAAAALGIGRLIKNSVQLGMQMEQTAVRFEVLTGSAKSAADVLDGIKRFAASTPFRFEELSQAGVQLLATGSSAAQLTNELRMLGDIAAAADIPIGELANIFGRARTQQTLYADELNKFTDRGIDVLSSFANQLGIDTTQVKEFASQGKISFENLRAALEELTSEGGNYNGMTDRLSETTAGKVSTAMDQATEAMTRMGAAFNPLIVAITDGFEEGNSLLQMAVGWVERLGDGAAIAASLLKDTFSIGQEVANFFTGEDSSGLFDASQFQALNETLDRMDERDLAREAEERLESLPPDPYQEELAKQAESLEELRSVWSGITDQTKKAAEEKERAEEVTALDDLSTAWSDITKQVEDAAKAEEKMVELGEEALANARKHFEEERKAAIKRREDIVSQMSGAGQEVGSGEDVAFMARLQNAELAAQSVTQPTEPTEEQLLEETKRQYELLKQEAAESKKQTAKLTALIKAVEENKIKPIR